MRPYNGGYWYQRPWRRHHRHRDYERYSVQSHHEEADCDHDHAYRRDRDDDWPGYTR